MWRPSWLHANWFLVAYPAYPVQGTCSTLKLQKLSSWLFLIQSSVCKSTVCKLSFYMLFWIGDTIFLTLLWFLTWAFAQQISPNWLLVFQAEATSEQVSCIFLIREIGRSSIQPSRLMLPYASIMSTSSRFRCLGAPNASVLAKFFNQRFGIPAAQPAATIASDYLPANLRIICQRIFGWASTQAQPKEKLSETRWMKNHRSQSEWEPGLSPRLPSFSILLPPSDSKTPARWVEIVPDQWVRLRSCLVKWKKCMALRWSSHVRPY